MGKKVTDEETSSFSLPPNSELLVVKSKTLAITLALLFSNQILAQDEPPQVQASGIQQRAIIIADAQEGDSPQPIQFQSIQLSGDISNGDGAMWSFASPEGATTMSFGLPAAGSGGSGLMNLLHNKSIRDEIELVDDQYKKMKNFYKGRQDAIMKEVQALIKPALSGDSKKGNSSVQLRGKKLQELMQKQQEDSEAALNDLLLPHQRKRLEQVSLRMRMKNMGTVRAITQNPTKEKLGISDDLEKKLKTKEAELKKEFEAEMAKLRAKHKKELLNVLPSKQRRQLEELLGDEFEYKEPDWRSRLKEMGARIEKREKE